MFSGSCVSLSSSLSSTNLSRDKKDVSCHAIWLKLVNVRKRGWLYESFMVMTIVFCNIFLWLPCGSGQAGFLASSVLTFWFCCPGPIIHLNPGHLDHLNSPLATEDDRESRRVVPDSGMLYRGLSWRCNSVSLFVFSPDTWNRGSHQIGVSIDCVTQFRSILEQSALVALMIQRKCSFLQVSAIWWKKSWW